jgi:uracil-DNA glycosylase family 4
MSGPYDQLLDATIQHLQQLKSRGVRSVNLSPEALASLHSALPAGAVTKPAPAPVAATRPANPISAPVEQAPKTIAPAWGNKETDLPDSAKSAVEPTSSPAPVDQGAKAEAMRELRERALVCMKCPHLASSRTNVVFGVGDINATLMFVGEAPGADEDRQGEPFVGAAGQLLTRIIQTMGLSRQTVYIGNILKCRPDTPGQSSGNRKPTLEEMKTCIPYLHSQIDLIQPKVLVALGATAVEGLLGKTEGITRLRGNWRTYRGIPLMPTFHPSYLLRNQALSEKRKVWEDILQVMERLEMPISEKQRGYFLRT